MCLFRGPHGCPKVNTEQPIGNQLLKGTINGWMSTNMSNMLSIWHVIPRSSGVLYMNNCWANA